MSESVLQSLSTFLVSFGRNGYSYKVAVALSLFLGWLGADRFYLGYPALGKFISCFFFVLKHIVMTELFVCTCILNKKC